MRFSPGIDNGEFFGIVLSSFPDRRLTRRQWRGVFRRAVTNRSTRCRTVNLYLPLSIIFPNGSRPLGPNPGPSNGWLRRECVTGGSRAILCRVNTGLKRFTVAMRGSYVVSRTADSCMTFCHLSSISPEKQNRFELFASVPMTCAFRRRHLPRFGVRHRRARATNQTTFGGSD